MPKQSKPGSCYFCGPTTNPITVEHVWPEWLSQAIRDVYPGKMFIQRRRQGDAVTNEWNSQLIDITTKSVCDKCNNIWLSDLEDNRIKPLLRETIISGVPVTLSADAQTVLAAWAYKMALLLQVASPNRPQFFAAEERSLFRQTTTAHPAATVWIAKYNFTGPWPAHAISAIQRLVPKSPNDPVVRLHVNVITAGYLVMQVLVLRRDDTQELIPTTQLAQLTEDGRRARLQIWPLEAESLTWPPVEAFDEAGVTSMRDEWVYAFTDAGGTIVD